MWGGAVLKELGLSRDERRIVMHGASRRLLTHRTAMRKIVVLLVLSAVVGVSFPFTLIPILKSLSAASLPTVMMLVAFMLPLLGSIPGLALSWWLRPEWRSALFSELAFHGFEVCSVCGFNRAELDDGSPCPECGACARGDR
ncbi:MAG: hypothetical protein D6692_08845 [Planctomycetota bacterium]|nr:MAG: hypothetical protein D6692_08845 [Planctomycetota bacterium]